MTRVLIVDDEADIRVLTSGILQDEGFATREAADSASALAGIEVRRPFVPNHRLPPFKGERAFGELPVAVSLYQQGLNLPSSAWLKPEQVERITGELLSIGSNG